MRITRRKLRNLISESVFDQGMIPLLEHENEEYINQGIEFYNLLNNTDIKYMGRQKVLHPMHWEDAEPNWPYELTFWSISEKTLKDFYKILEEKTRLHRALTNDYDIEAIRLSQFQEKGYFLDMWNSGVNNEIIT